MLNHEQGLNYEVISETSPYRGGHGRGVRDSVPTGCDGALPVPAPADPEDHQHPGEGAQAQP